MTIQNVREVLEMGGASKNHRHIKCIFTPKLFCEESQRNVAETRLHPIQGPMTLVLPLVSLKGEAGLLLLTLKYSYFCTFVSIGHCCWPFLSTFLPPLPFSDLSSRSPPILDVVFLVF